MITVHLQYVHRTSWLHGMSRCTVFCMPYPSKTDRQTILSAAVKELAHGGIRDLSLRNIAASLDLAPNAIYRYFSDRSGTRSCPGKRSCPATGTGAEEGSRRVRTGYRNPQDVICLHQVRKGQPSPLRGDDESPRARSTMRPPTKASGRSLSSRCNELPGRTELRRRPSRFGRSSMEP